MATKTTNTSVETTNSTSSNGATPAPTTDRSTLATAKCPISRAMFAKGAKTLRITIGDTTIEADAREFSSGSLGWYLTGKVSVEVDGVKVKCQVGANVTVVGSKELPQ